MEATSLFFNLSLTPSRSLKGRTIVSCRAPVVKPADSGMLTISC